MRAAWPGTSAPSVRPSMSSLCEDCMVAATEDDDEEELEDDSGDVMALLTGESCSPRYLDSEIDIRS